VKKLGGAEPPKSGSPRGFQGWQRGACLFGVGLLLVLVLLLVISTVLGLLGVR
jgi:hypothetical protein